VESVVFRVAIPKFKDETIQTYNFACYFVWVLNLVAQIEGGTRLRVFERRLLRRIIGPRKDEVTDSGENYIMRKSVICTPYPILYGW
jgi:hypothetical protein